ncbi:calcium-binding EGF-like domain-containing protein [Polyangium jinanense]|uniref:Calcium-binding EGF-like domain-containing protein n=1 Tax=Polyangium jinanense TaxID=2829994 RepID=A0A9X4AXK9_9BACT|nr:calcium-binding EGF-like domain-containing protein [Polyangium jinanense]MDC3956015.1 calcium-binding EGF-like domain-containing protein [Polyangium jinanense]MDC3982954.1 calcium-binding EGF-like domain-containing protein [Polyangium jinanense]MDC3986375.1 calcium-binding EGF-like domain-containing protein [Polyangium jinanense]
MTHFTSLRPLRAMVTVLGLSSFAFLGGACSSTDTQDAEHLGAAEEHLTDAQCSFFDVNGKNQICHYTGSANHPYTIIKTSEQGCINGHAIHANDYIAVGDPTCQGGGCLPATAPCDATLPCCDGLTCQNGTCVDLCAGVTCTASDACHVAGTCDPATGACSNPVAADGTACDDGNGCTVTDSCGAGTCTGSGNPCQNGGTCNPAEPYTCTCPAEFTGPNCETPACVPTTCAAQGATCGTIPDGCGGTLTCGGPCGPACPCAANPAWQAALAGTIVNDGRCTNYSFPAPCHTSGNNSWAVSDQGTSVVELMAGTDSVDGESFSYCGVQVMQVSDQFAGNCSGGAFPVMNFSITAAEVATCRAEIANFAAAQNTTCN